MALHQQPVGFSHLSFKTGGKIIRKRAPLLFLILFCAVLLAPQAGFAANPKQTVSADMSKDFGPNYEIEDTGNNVRGLTVEKGGDAILGKESSITVSGNGATGIYTWGSGTKSQLSAGDGFKTVVSGSGTNPVYGLQFTNSAGTIAAISKGASIDVSSVGAAYGVHFQSGTNDLTVGDGLGLSVLSGGTGAAHGLYFSNTAATVAISNNATIDVRSSGTGLVYGVYSYSGTNDLTIGDGLNLSVSSDQSGAAAGLQFRSSGGTVAEIGRNALIDVRTGGAAYGLYSQMGTNEFTIGDGLGLYVSGGSTSYGILLSSSGSSGVSVDIKDNATIVVETRSNAYGIQLSDNTQNVVIGDNLSMDVSGIGSTVYALNIAAGASDDKGITIGNSADIRVENTSASSNPSSALLRAYGGTIRVGDDAKLTASGTRVRGIEASSPDRKVIIGENATLNVSGKESRAVMSYGGAKVTMGEGATVVVVGDGAYGVYSEYGGSAKVSGDISLTGNNSYGVHARYGSSSAFVNSIMISGDKAIGAYADSDDASIVVSETINVTGGASTKGAYAGSDASVTAKNIVSTTQGASEATRVYGAYATGNNSKVSVGESIDMKGNYSTAAYATGGGSTAVGGSVQAEGSNVRGAHANGANSKVTVSGDAAVSGDNAIGAHADTGGASVVVGETINIKNGASAKGAYASVSNASVTAKNVVSTAQGTTEATRVYGAYANNLGSLVTILESIDMKGDYSTAAYAANSAVVAVGGSVRSEGSYARGAYATGANSKVTVSGDAAVSGDNAIGAHADTSGASVIVDGAINIKNGAGAKGAYASVSGASVTAKNIVSTAQGTTDATRVYGAYVSGSGANVNIGESIDMKGDYSTAAYAASGGSVAVGGSVQSEGGDARGAHANGLNAKVTVGGGVTASGDRVYGAYAEQGGSIAVTGDIETRGAAGGGAYATGNNSKIDMSGGAAAFGDGSHAVYATDRAKITLSGDSAITTSGTDAAPSGRSAAQSRAAAFTT